MARTIILASAITIIILAALFGCSPPSSNTTIYAIGETGPGGGIVFYDKGNVSGGWRYLEAAPYDQGTLGWGTQITTNASGTAIGDGKTNTATIVTDLGSGTYAASICANLSLGGLSDWFLPSKDEATLMLQNLAGAGIGQFVTNGVYWTSSESDQYDAWAVSYGGSSVMACTVNSGQ